MLLSEPYTLQHWDHSCGRLNSGQIAALLHAMVNEFQLIQGPPGNSIADFHVRNWKCIVHVIVWC